MAFVLIVSGIVLVILLMVIVVKFGGKGHLDVERSQSNHRGEVEARSRFPWS